MLTFKKKNWRKPSYWRLFTDNQQCLINYVEDIIKLYKVHYIVKCFLHYLWINRQVLRRVVCISSLLLQIDITAYYNLRKGYICTSDYRKKEIEMSTELLARAFSVLTKCRVTLRASRQRSGVLSSSQRACPMRATLLESRTSEPTSRKPAQLAGWAKCFVCWTVCIASPSALLTRDPWTPQLSSPSHKGNILIICHTVCYLVNITLNCDVSTLIPDTNRSSVKESESAPWSWFFGGEK